MNSNALDRATPPWADIRRDFEARVFKKPADLCRHYGIALGTLYSRVRRENWKRQILRGGPRKANEPLARLKALARRKIGLLEEWEAEGEAVSDTAITQMTQLLKLIERITVLEQKEREVERAMKPPRVVNDARRLELARRIEAIQRQLAFERRQAQEKEAATAPR